MDKRISDGLLGLNVPKEVRKIIRETPVPEIDPKTLGYIIVNNQTAIYEEIIDLKKYVKANLLRKNSKRNPKPKRQKSVR